jgi:hypothetical protein
MYQKSPKALHTLFNQNAMNISTECVATHGRPAYSDHTNNSQRKFPKMHSIEQMAGTRLDKEFFPIARGII